MPIPPAEQLGAVIRGLDTVERDGETLRRLTAERTYPAPVEDVWDAITNPERIPRWIGGAVTGELRLGGRYQIEGNAGGEVLACEPPRSLVDHLGVRRSGQLGGRLAGRGRRRAPGWSCGTRRRSTRACGSSSGRVRSASAGR